MTQTQIVPENFEVAAAENPQGASFVENIIVAVVQQVEWQYPGLTGEQKKAKCLEILRKKFTEIYNEFDRNIYDLPPLVDFLARFLVIPLLPALIDQTVKLLNGVGIFERKGAA